MAESTHSANYYPVLQIPKNEKPNRWLAIPFIGFLIRCLLVLPVGIWLLILSFVYLFYMLVVPFVVLFKNKYWERAYNFFVGYIKLYTKTGIYVFGMTDKYPGFQMSDDGLFKLQITKPEKPSILLSFPLVGFLIRIILIFPYAIYESVINNGAQIALFLSWFNILFKGKYPERFHLFIHDYFRLSLASTMYTSYLSDKYPSFKISTKYKKTVIALIIGGILLMFVNAMPTEEENSMNDFNYDNINLEESYDLPMDN